MTDQETADAKKVAYKAKLLVEQIGFAAALASAFAPRVHMIKAASRPGRPHRIQCADGGWIEIDPETRRVVTWGSGRTARDLASALKDGDDAYATEHLEPTATAAALGSPRRAAPVLSDDRLKEIADGWRKLGHTDIEMDDSGVWIALKDGTRLHDTGGRVTVHGPVTDEALRAMVAHTKAEWHGRHRLFGPWTDKERERMWLESMRQGVTLLEYEPSAELIARWEAEQAETARSTGAALRPDEVTLAPASTGPIPSTAGGDGGTAEPEPDLSAFDKKAGDLDRRQADLEKRQRATIKERADVLIREQHLSLREAQDTAFRERDRMRQEQERLAEARAILARARALAVEKGLDYDAAIALAKAEHLAEQEHDYDRRAGPRR